MRRRDTHAIRDVQHVSDEDATDSELLLGHNADRVTVLAESELRCVVDLHDGVARAVDEGELVLGRLLEARIAV